VTFSGEGKTRIEEEPPKGIEGRTDEISQHNFYGGSGLISSSLTGHHNVTKRRRIRRIRSSFGASTLSRNGIDSPAHGRRKTAHDDHSHESKLVERLVLWIGRSNAVDDGEDEGCWEKGREFQPSLRRASRERG